MNKQERLTSFIGECVHEPVKLADVFQCKLCGDFVTSGNKHTSRTFTTAEDWEAIATALRRPENMAIITSFELWVEIFYYKINGPILSRWIKMLPAEKCQLFSNFLESEEI